MRNAANDTEIRWRPERKALKAAIGKVPTRNLNLALHLIGRLETYTGPANATRRPDRK